METLIINIIQNLTQEVPKLTLVDEDTGQLDTELDTYPVTFPCLLIAGLEVDWKDLKPGDTQRGEAIITTRLAIDCYDDTHGTSGTTERIRQRMELDDCVNRMLHNRKFTDRTSELSRVKTRHYTIPGGIKVYEHTYRLRITS